MFALRVSHHGVTEMPIVPQGVEINSDVYIDTTLKSIFENEIAELSGGDLNMVVFHHDNVPAHQSSISQDWLKSFRIKFIPEKDWPSNSLDLAPMDFGINGILKRIFLSEIPKF
jgi:hypothetical protein